LCYVFIEIFYLAVFSLFIFVLLFILLNLFKITSLFINLVYINKKKKKNHSIRLLDNSKSEFYTQLICTCDIFIDFGEINKTLLLRQKSLFPYIVLKKFQLHILQLVKLLFAFNIVVFDFLAFYRF